jgi:hypothetical protein
MLRNQLAAQRSGQSAKEIYLTGSVAAVSKKGASADR